MIFNLSLNNFRSYKEESFEFNSGVNLIIGPNASGKTNLIEAVSLICNQKSFRLKGADLINYQAQFFKLQAIDQDSNIRELFYYLQDDKLIKKYLINHVEIKKKTLNKQIPVVIFEPTDLNIINGSAEKRRFFVDNINKNLYLDYQTDLNNYRRIVDQRNSLLKLPQSKIVDFFPWNIRLAEIANRLIKRRISLINYLNQQINSIYNQIAINKKYSIEIHYQSQFELDKYANQLLKKFEDSFIEEKKYHYTLFGPHHDDLLFTFNDRNAKSSASRGEIRTLILVLKILEANLIEEKSNYKPILLFDDVFSELDGSRRKYLTEYFKKYQIFITTTDADVIIKEFSKSSNLILLNNF